jgi:hypothetical protein
MATEEELMRGLASSPKVEREHAVARLCNAAAEVLEVLMPAAKALAEELERQAEEERQRQGRRPPRGPDPHR